VKKAEEKTVYTYEVFPINFNMLSFDEQCKVVDRFKGFLNGLSRELRIYIVKSSKTVDLGGGQSFETTYYRFFMESFGSPIDHLLSLIGLKYQRATEVPNFEPVKEFSKWVALQGGHALKTFTIYALPGSLVEGFLTETYGIADRVMISVNPIPPDKATNRIERFRKLVRGLVYYDASKGRSAQKKDETLTSMAEELTNKLMMGLCRLFEVRANLSITGEDRAELRKNERRLKETLQARNVFIDSPSYLQLELALGLEGKRLTMDTDTAACFFPFVSEDIIETPGGVFLGVNGMTGAPVIYDPLLRMNQNVAIIGATGCGKSYTSKILLTRLARRHKNLAFFIIDPENEYRYVGQLHGAQILDIRPDTLLGLDPVQIFSASRDSAAAILSDIVKIPLGSELYSELRTVIGASNTIFDVFMNASPELKKYLRSLVDGADRFLVAGDPPPFSRRMIFNLAPLREGLQLSERSLTLQAANILIFSKIWQMIDNPQFIPLQDPKVVMVDEVWMFTSMPAATRFLEGVARRGRKRNIIFVTNTQRVADVLDSPGGRAVIENCATKILMRQDAAAIKLIGDVFNLSDNEKDAILDFKPGSGILAAEGIHIPVNFYATSEEDAIFTTKPAERLL
jgi:hypothetical protein